MRNGLRPRLAVVACVAALVGCSGDGGSEPSSAPSSGEVTAAAVGPVTADPPAYVYAGSPLVQRLWRPVGSLPSWRTGLPRRLDPAAIEGAPSLSDAPVTTAVLAIGTDPAPYSVSGVAVLSAAGEWRVVDRRRMGLREPDLVEQQYLLSPDGRTLALGDQYGIVLVDLGTAMTRRVPLDARDVVLHWWTPDGAELVFTPRRSSERTMVLTVDDEAVRRVDYRAWASSVGPAGDVVELLPRATSPTPTYTAVQRHDADGSSTTVELGVRLQPGATIGRESGSLVPVLQTPRDATAPTGVLALDPTSGEAVGLLELDGGKAAWTSMRGATEDGWLLLNVGHGPGGGLVAWDPVGRRLRGVLAFDEQATSVSLAAGALDRVRANGARRLGDRADLHR